VAVEGRKLRPKPTQIQNSVDPTQKVIGWNAIFKIELIEIIPDGMGGLMERPARISLKD